MHLNYMTIYEQFIQYNIFFYSHLYKVMSSAKELIQIKCYYKENIYNIYLLSVVSQLNPPTNNFL